MGTPLTVGMKAAIGLILAFLVFLVAGTIAALLMGSWDIYIAVSVVVFVPVLLVLLFFTWRGTRWAYLDYDLPGLDLRVHVDGRVNDPATLSRGWTAEVTIPWTALADLACGRALPPRDGDVWGMLPLRMEGQGDNKTFILQLRNNEGALTEKRFVVFRDKSRIKVTPPEDIAQYQQSKSK